MNSTKEQGSRETTGRNNPNLTLWLTKIYRCGFTGNGYNTAMKKALAHLPNDREYKIIKQQLEQLSPCVKKLHEVTEKVCKEKLKTFLYPTR